MVSGRTLYLKRVCFEEKRNPGIEQSCIVFFFIYNKLFFIFKGCHPPKIVSSLVSMSYAFLVVLTIRCCGHSQISIDPC